METLGLPQVDREATETLTLTKLPLDYHLQHQFPCPRTIAQPARLFSPRLLAHAAAPLSQGETHEICLTVVPNPIVAAVQHRNQPTTLHLVSTMSLVRRRRKIFRTVRGLTTGTRRPSSPHTALHHHSAQTTHLRLHIHAPSASIRTTLPRCQLSSQVAKPYQVH